MPPLSAGSLGFSIQILMLLRMFYRWVLPLILQLWRFRLDQPMLKIFDIQLFEGQGACQSIYIYILLFGYRSVRTQAHKQMSWIVSMHAALATPASNVPAAAAELPESKLIVGQTPAEDFFLVCGSYLGGDAAWITLISSPIHKDSGMWYRAGTPQPCTRRGSARGYIIFFYRRYPQACMQAMPIGALSASARPHVVIHTQYALETPYPPFNPVFAFGLRHALLFNTGDTLNAVSWGTEDVESMANRDAGMAVSAETPQPTQDDTPNQNAVLAMSTCVIGYAAGTWQK
jgi:hypothetical protein